MSRILSFTSGPQDWQKLLADKEKHWKKGYSARTLAHCWKQQMVFPPRLTYHSLRVLILYWQISLLFLQSLSSRCPCLAVCVPHKMISLYWPVHHLARYPLWLRAKSMNPSVPPSASGEMKHHPGKRSALRFLLRSLGLNTVPEDSIRYQLLHRAASAIITGEKYRAVAAVLVVHSFSQAHTGWSDYQAFTNLFGVEAVVGTIQKLSISSSLPLFGMWVVGNPSFLEC